MMSLFVTAFIIGGIGSMHCIGMCGPLAFSLPAVNDSLTSKFISSFLYNAGRIFTYAALGALFGTLGGTFVLFGYQQWLSISLGALIILFLVFGKLGNVSTVQSMVLAGFFNKVRERLGKLFLKKNYQSIFYIGLLNGLLPCGLVYMAVAGAVATASIFKSSLFMASFGFGTLPVMWGVSFFGSFINFKIRKNIRAAYPYLMLVMACLLIVRGLGLGIPYLSPANFSHVANAVECHN